MTFSSNDLKAENVVQGWVWRELEQYKTRICEIGVDGHALYNLEGLTRLHLAESCLFVQHLVQYCMGMCCGASC